jgi:hypothetical protein
MNSRGSSIRRCVNKNRLVRGACRHHMNVKEWVLQKDRQNVVLCPDVASCMDSRFDCRDLLQRSVIHYAAARKASSAIISAPIQGVTTGTVAGVSRGPSEDRSSGLVSIQAGPFILAAFIAAAGVNPSY